MDDHGPVAEPPLGVFVGLTTLDVIHRADHAPEPNEKITASWQACAAGGPAANAAVVYAALGGHARLITAIGRSPVAAIIRDDLQRHGVEVVDVDAGNDAEPAISAVLVNDRTGDRAVVSPDAGASRIGAPAALQALLAGADTVLVDGHHPQLALAAAQAAAGLDLPVVLDAGRWKPVMDALLPSAGVVICSADFRTPDAADSDQTAHDLVARGVSAVAVTRGADPVLWWENGDTGEVPVGRISVRDTLGAGDVFHGAFCWYRSTLAGAFDEQLAAAARVAALRCSHVGPREWLAELGNPQRRSNAPTGRQEAQ